VSRRIEVGADHVPKDHAPAGSPKPKRYPRLRFRCPHALQVWTEVPHPRYGDRLPHFIPSLVRDPSCGCPR